LPPAGGGRVGQKAPPEGWLAGGGMGRCFSGPFRRESVIGAYTGGGRAIHLDFGQGRGERPFLDFLAQPVSVFHQGKKKKKGKGNDKVNRRGTTGMEGPRGERGGPAMKRKGEKIVEGKGKKKPCFTGGRMGRWRPRADARGGPGGSDGSYWDSRGGEKGGACTEGGRADFSGLGCAGNQES